MHPPPALLGIDWGTSNRRAWWLAADGSVLAGHTDDQGLLAAQGRFAPALDVLLAQGPALPPGAPVLMSGMVGSASGWREAPYLANSQPLRSLAQQLVPVTHGERRCLIVPGVCFEGEGGAVDVMRGEETQLLGALAVGHGDGWYVLPGTHSKWVRLAQGRVAHLSTYMTGELFALLTQHGTLAAITRDGGEDPAAFGRGLQAAGGSGLSHALFGCRARVVAGRMPAHEAREYLSGLLIGAEWADVQQRAGGAPEHIRVIGSPALERRYAHSALHFGCRVEALDAAALQVAAFMVLAQSLAGRAA